MAEMDLRGEPLDLGSRVNCVAARWWSARSACAVVVFDELGNSSNVVASFALRLDLEKIAFLDHAKDRTIDNILQHKVKDIWEVIVKKRRLHLAPTPAASGTLAPGG